MNLKEFKKFVRFCKKEGVLEAEVGEYKIKLKNIIEDSSVNELFKEEDNDKDITDILLHSVRR